MESKDNIIFKDDERSNMDYAMFQEFGGNDLLKKIINEVEDLFVKGRFRDNKGNVEHMWMKVSRYNEDKNRYEGNLKNDPFVLKNYKFDDEVELSLSDVCNFAYEDGDKRIWFLPPQ